jgi:hypothetical protein
MRLRLFILLASVIPIATIAVISRQWLINSRLPVLAKMALFVVICWGMIFGWLGIVWATGLMQWVVDGE